MVLSSLSFWRWEELQEAMHLIVSLAYNSLGSTAFSYITENAFLSILLFLCDFASRQRMDESRMENDFHLLHS